MLRTLPSLVTLAFLLTVAAVSPAHAQEQMVANAMTSASLFPVAPIAPIAPAAAAVTAAAAADAEQGPTFVRAGFTPRSRRPQLLGALYASQALLQALDAHSTYAAIGRGAHEANPLMKGIVGNKGTMLAVKAGVAASTIWIAERMWKRGNRAGALATMLVVNSVTAAVVANNYRVASSLK